MFWWPLRTPATFIFFRLTPLRMVHGFQVRYGPEPKARTITMEREAMYHPFYYLPTKFVYSSRTIYLLSLKVLGQSSWVIGCMIEVKGDPPTNMCRAKCPSFLRGRGTFFCISVPYNNVNLLVWNFQPFDRLSKCAGAPLFCFSTMGVLGLLVSANISGGNISCKTDPPYLICWWPA